MHPFRFGVTMSRAASAEAWVASARRAEELGYDILLMPDHLGSQLSPIAALTAAAVATTRLRVGSYVFANDYHHPLVLAREAATLDWLSAGRFELGLGAGWNVADYRKHWPAPVGRRAQGGMDRLEGLREDIVDEEQDDPGGASREHRLPGLGDIAESADGEAQVDVKPANAASMTVSPNDTAVPPPDAGGDPPSIPTQ